MEIAHPAVCDNVTNMKINVLLEAAAMLEMREKNEKAWLTATTDEKGALQSSDNRSRQPPPSARKGSAPKTKYSRKNMSSESRAAHNELEKTRRAQLRRSLDELRDAVNASSAAGLEPNSAAEPTQTNSDSSTRNTTLTLLTRARLHIEALAKREKGLSEEKRRLAEQGALLRRHLELLLLASKATPATSSQPTRKRRHSESSQSTVSAFDDNAEELASEAGSSSAVRTPKRSRDNSGSSSDLPTADLNAATKEEDGPTDVTGLLLEKATTLLLCPPASCGQGAFVSATAGPTNMLTLPDLCYANTTKLLVANFLESLRQLPPAAGNPFIATSQWIP